MRTILSALLIIVIIIIIIIITRNLQKLSTPSTIKKIQQERIAALNALIEPIVGKKKNIYEVEKTMPENQQLLLNYCVTGCRLTGYLGPLQDGVFAEEDAVRLAYGAGCRLFVLEISQERGMPVLIARDHMGFKRSLNDGSLVKTFTSLGSLSKTDPIILVLYFLDAPLSGSENYLEYLSKVAIAMEPIIPYHLGLTDAGDFTRQKKASELFTYSPEFYREKIIVLTNADTSGFRTSKRTYSPKEDLDFFIHCRIYSLVSGLGISESAGGGTSINAIVSDDSYFLTTPPDKISSVINMTRNTFCLVMRKDPSWLGDPTLATTYGIHCVATDMETAAASETSWNPKEEPLRFTKPAPIVPTVPNPQLDARGGFLTAPKISS